MTDVAWIVASGPSLRDVDLSFLKDRWVIVINRSHALVPVAKRFDIWWTDWRFWAWQQGDLLNRHYRAPSIVRLHAAEDPLTRHAGYPYEVRTWPLTGEHGFDPVSPGIRHGSNGGYAAINLAYHLGARRVFLLGYDMRRGPDGSAHWHGDYPWGGYRDDVAANRWIPNFRTLKAEKPNDLLVLNVDYPNMGALDAFTHIGLKTAFQLEKEWASDPATAFEPFPILQSGCSL